METEQINISWFLDDSSKIVVCVEGTVFEKIFGKPFVKPVGWDLIPLGPLSRTKQGMEWIQGELLNSAGHQLTLAAREQDRLAGMGGEGGEAPEEWKGEKRNPLLDIEIPEKVEIRLAFDGYMPSETLTEEPKDGKIIRKAPTASGTPNVAEVGKIKAKKNSNKSNRPD